MSFLLEGLTSSIYSSLSALIRFAFLLVSTYPHARWPKEQSLKGFVLCLGQDMQFVTKNRHAIPGQRLASKIHARDRNHSKTPKWYTRTMRTPLSRTCSSNSEQEILCMVSWILEFSYRLRTIFVAVFIIKRVGEVKLREDLLYLYTEEDFD